MTPLAIVGGVNLYAFCDNDGVNRYDLVGLNGLTDWISGLFGGDGNNSQPRDSGSKTPSENENKPPEGSNGQVTPINKDPVQLPIFEVHLPSDRGPTAEDLAREKYTSDRIQNYNNDLVMGRVGSDENPSQKRYDNIALGLTVSGSTASLIEVTAEAKKLASLTKYARWGGSTVFGATVFNDIHGLLNHSVTPGHALINFAVGAGGLKLGGPGGFLVGTVYGILDTIHPNFILDRINTPYGPTDAATPVEGPALQYYHDVSPQGVVQVLDQTAFMGQ